MLFYACAHLCMYSGTRVFISCFSMHVHYVFWYTWWHFILIFVNVLYVMWCHVMFVSVFIHVLYSDTYFAISCLPPGIITCVFWHICCHFMFVLPFHVCLRVCMDSGDVKKLFCEENLKQHVFSLFARKLQRKWKVYSLKHAVNTNINHKNNDCIKNVFFYSFWKCIRLCPYDWLIFWTVHCI